MESGNFDTPPVHPESPEVKPLFRGVWAEHLTDGQELVVGGSNFLDDKSADKKLKLDFASFKEQTERFTEGNMVALYEQHKERVVDWLKKAGSDMDPYIFFVCYQVQQKLHALLEIDPKENAPHEERVKIYAEKGVPALSDLKGNTYCAERAALGKWLLQQVNVPSAYVGGISMKDAKDDDNAPEDHSWVVVGGDENTPDTFLFDIARPKSQSVVPRVLKPAVPFTYELLQGKEKLLVETREVLRGGTVWFGVGRTTVGKKNLIEYSSESK